MTWRQQANCRGMDPNIFHPAPGRGVPAARLWDRARAVCSSCPVKAECLTFALTEESTTDAAGMYGGTTPLERARLVHKIGRRAAVAFASLREAS